MCMSCLNYVRTQRRIEECSTMVLFSDPDMSKFKKNTPALLKATVDHLSAQNGILSNTKFAELQTMLGINYNECGVLLSPYRDMLNMPISRFTDWFHDLLASGGMFVYIE